MVEALRGLIPHLGPVSRTEQLRASLGALVGILATGLISRAALGDSGAVPLLVAPMGASAVLLFAVSSSPLAQPWSILGGNIAAALIGITVARLVPDLMVAAALACAGAIGTMILLRCLHPPSGAVALTAVLGGPAVHQAGYGFAIWPVGLNSLVLLVAALMFNNLTGRRYPHRAGQPGHSRQAARSLSLATTGVSRDDLDEVLREDDQIVDVDPADLARTLEETESRGRGRRLGDLTCADIMTTAVVVASEDLPLAEGRALMLEHRIEVLPVTKGGSLIGVVTPSDLLRHLEPTRGELPWRRGLTEAFARSDRRPSTLRDIMKSPVTWAVPATRIADLAPMTADLGLNHLPIVAPDRRVIGMASQADLVAALLGGPAPGARHVDGAAQHASPPA